MHEHTKSITKAAGVPRLVLIGNPNVGKSVIFQLLTGQYATVSNYPGTTVELAYGTSRLHREEHLVIDTPGVCNLVPFSEDERVSRDILLNEDIEAVLQVADAKNLSRGLFITLQLIEMGLPLILALNMADEARVRGISIDAGKLAEQLGISTVLTVATEKVGLHQLRAAFSDPRRSPYTFSYGEVIEPAIAEITELLPKARISARALALMLLAGDRSLEAWQVKKGQGNNLKKIKEIVSRIQRSFSRPLSYVINQVRTHEVRRLLERVYHREAAPENFWGKRLGEWTMHSLWGWPILFIILYALYQFVGNFGAQVLVGFLEDDIFGKFINPFLIAWVPRVLPIPLLAELLVGEYGIFTMALTYALAIVFPIVGTFFIAFGILEDSGYMPRLAVMLNRAFRFMGLNGKAVLPMILGLGCDTMATMTARILDSQKERLIVILLLALAVPCSAQLGVILGMFGGLPEIGRAHV